MSEARVIKRYANRKLYDTQHSRYVTLDQISEMIRAGEDVKIVDNKSKEDLTSVTLAQIIFEEEKKRSFMPLGAMRNIIQNGGDWIAEAQRRVSGLWPKRRDDELAGSGPGAGADANGAQGPTEDGAMEGDHATDAAKARGLAALREWAEHSRGALGEWQNRMDERIRTAIGGISPLSSLHKDVKGLQDRIAELEQKLKQLADENDHSPHE